MAPGRRLLAVWLRQRSPSPTPLPEPYQAVTQMEFCELPGGVPRNATTAVAAVGLNLIR